MVMINRELDVLGRVARGHRSWESCVCEFAEVTVCYTDKEILK